MKTIFFMGTSLDEIRDFPNEVKREVGFQLDKIQQGLEPSNWKPMPSVGKGVREIRIKDASGAYRVLYIAKLKSGVFVLAAFQKKQQKTPKHEIEAARGHYSELMK